jgi:hypothetical protein
MTDPDTSAAIEALAFRLRNNRDEDPDVFALEFITALRGHGWRPTEAKAKPDPHTPGSGLPQASEVADLLARTRADLAARAVRTDPQDAA